MSPLARQYWLYPDLDSPEARRVNQTHRQMRRGGLRASRYGGRVDGHAQIERSFKVKDIAQANLVSSNVPDKPGVHAPCIDIDLPCRLIPSSTENHYHLYIEKEIPEDKYWALLDAMADAGIVEQGYVDASKAKGGTFVRPPGVRKHKVWKEDWDAKVQKTRTEMAAVREPELVGVG